MKNRKMSTTITTAILAVNIVCLLLLYILANTTMTKIMKQSAMENLHDSLNVQANMIEEYIVHQEDLLIAYSNAPVVVEFLKDPDNEEKRIPAQEYTEQYYGWLDNWEGLYIGEWNTHVIAHSNPAVVGMVTREGESLKQLQDEMLSQNGPYNAGMIVSPASQELVVSMYCPVFDYDGKTIVGYVGGGPFAAELDALLTSVKDESAKYYMINPDTGTYIFAEEDELMATEIEDEMLLSIMEKVAVDGENPIGDMEYIHPTDGSSIAAYQYLPKYGWIVVSCNSEKSIYADVHKNMYILGMFCVVSEVLIGLLSWLFIHFSTKPLKYVEKAIMQLKELNLEKDHNLDNYINGKSEVGQIATAINSLYDSIGEMLEAEKEKQIAIAERESKERFLASMSHEIRTPINIVIGMNELILREGEDETVLQYARNIESASRMLLCLVNDVLDLSKMEAGKLQIVESDYTLSSMLSDAVLAVTARIRQKDLELKQEFDESLPSVLRGDEIRIKQILNNLLSNAAKYTEKGTITFAVKGIYDEKGFSLEMSVTDTGIGIREEDMEKLFERFLRLEMDKNRYIEGTGLGLSIAKQLVDNMNGTFHVTSEYGKGSCFTVRIPQTIVDETPISQTKQTDGEARRRQADACADMSQAKVLVVDDNSTNQLMMKMLLKRMQIQIECAGGGYECLQMTKEKKYDLILMDHMMPEPNGIQTLHMLRADEDNQNRNTKVIVTTANAISGMEELYKNEGFDGYITKPIMPEKMEELLVRYLAVDGEK